MEMNRKQCDESSCDHLLFFGRDGFDFLGYQFAEPGLVGVSKRSLAHFALKLSRRIGEGASGEEITEYVRRWIGWSMGGLSIGFDLGKVRKIEKMIKESLFDLGFAIVKVGFSGLETRKPQRGEPNENASTAARNFI